MKTFSFLNWFTFVCLAFALVLVGNTADAQDDAGVTIDKAPSREYAVGETVTVTLTTTEGGKKATGATLDITVDGGIRVTSQVTADRVYEDDRTMGSSLIFTNGTTESVKTNDPEGEVKLIVRIDSPPSGSIRVRWRKHSFDQSTTLMIEPPEVVREVQVADKKGTSIVVLPPIPCADEYQSLSHLVASYLSEGKVEEIGETGPLKPASLQEIQTHQGLLDAIKPLRDDLKGLAARWDDPDPAADPADPTDKDTPPNTFRVPIVILNAEDLSGWQFDIAYNPQILEVVEVSAEDYEIFEGDFLQQGPTMTFFQEGTVQQAFGEIIRISQTRIATGDEENNSKADLIPQGAPGWETEISDRKLTDSINGANGTGELVSICFRVKEFAEESLGLHNLQLSDSVGNRIEFTTIVHPVVVTHQFAPEDVNRDTIVNTKDLMIIAANLGLAKPINPRADVNNDGIVNALDLVIVAQHIMDRAPAVKVRDQNMLAPPLHGNVAVLDPETIQAWIDFARVEDDGSIIYDLAISNLEGLLVSHTPTETKLLLNYPNPFNPETWIPYQLAEATEVTISIYTVNGMPIRTLALGHQAAGVYQSKSQAAYWDGRNELGERVASGVYFYTLTAGDFSATGKMLVRK